MIFNQTAADEAMKQWHRSCGRTLTEYRKDRKHTQRTLAARSGISQATINRIEAGLFPAADATKYRLAVALNCEVTDIWPTMPAGLFRAATTGGAGVRASDIGVKVA